MFTLKDSSTTPRLTIDGAGDTDIQGGTPNGVLSVGGKNILNGAGQLGTSVVSSLSALRVRGSVLLALTHVTVNSITYNYYTAVITGIGLSRPALVNYSGSSITLTQNDGNVLGFASNNAGTVNFTYF